MNTVIVTGASGNLGQAVIQKFLQDDATILHIDLHKLDKELNIKYIIFVHYN